MKKFFMMASLLCVLTVAVFVLTQLQPERLDASVRTKMIEAQNKIDGKIMTAQNQTPAQPAPEKKPEQAAAPAATPVPDTDPNIVKVKMDTTKGAVVLEFHKDWSPKGVARIEEIVKEGIFKDAKFFRVVTQPRNFVVQFGIPGDPDLAKKWWNNTIQDDPTKPGLSNKAGTITFAKSGAPNSRTTQLFINLGDNTFLDSMGFTPIGKVVEGMDVIRSFNSKYQDDPTSSQGQIVAGGNKWLDSQFPGLDSIKTFEVIK